MIIIFILHQSFPGTDARDVCLSDSEREREGIKWNSKCTYEEYRVTRVRIEITWHKHGNPAD